MAIIIFPSFTNPPHVDYWEAFFTFQQVDSDPGLSFWPYIVNHDPWRHGTFRPLLYTILYIEHRLFGSSFVWNHISNFFFYCLLLILLFLLGKGLGARKLELAGFLSVFAVLYSHCDILSLSFHISLIFGLCAMTTGFILYIHYLEGRGRCYILFAAGLSFLLGMFCYETFCSWPPALLILLFSCSRSRPVRRYITPTLFLVGLIYLIYVSIFILTRFASHLSGEMFSPSMVSVLTGFAFSFFNLFYNGIGVNIIPNIAFPGRYQGYSEMLGFIPQGKPGLLVLLVYGLSSIVLILIGLIIFHLARRRKNRALVSVVFLGYLYLSNFSTLVIARSTTNNFGHILRQFRYQLIPNALLILAVCVIISAFFRPTRKVRTILFVILILVFSLNSYFTRRHIDTVTERLTPLRELLENIRKGMDCGDITPSRRLYLADGFSTSFPGLCWNKGIGRKMWGTYQWLFTGREIRCFSRNQEYAYWTIDFLDAVYIENQR